MKVSLVNDDGNSSRSQDNTVGSLEINVDKVEEIATTVVNSHVFYSTKLAITLGVLHRSYSSSSYSSSSTRMRTRYSHDSHDVQVRA